MEHILTAVRENWVLLAVFFAAMVPGAYLLWRYLTVRRLRKRVVETTLYCRFWFDQSFKAYNADLTTYCPWIAPWTAALFEFMRREADATAFRPFDLVAARLLFKNAEEYYEFTKTVDQVVRAIALLKFAYEVAVRDSRIDPQIRLQVKSICAPALGECILPDHPHNLREADAALKGMLEKAKSALQRVVELGGTQFTAKALGG